MNIAVIFTGGTIGSTVNGNWTSLDTASRQALINGYRQRHPEDTVNFTVRTPYTILSEHLNAEALNTLLEAVEAEEAGDVDGIIVTHGTDTLAYSSAALALRFPSPRCPILVVSANYPLDDPRTNGHAHFEAAVAYIERGAPALTLTAYRNPTTTAVTLHHANRFYLQPELAEEVIGAAPPAAVFENGEVTLVDAAVPDRLPMTNRYPAHSRVLMATAVPGMGYPYALEGIKAVLFRPYHSGTLNTADQMLTEFCKKAQNNRIPLYISATGHDADYDSTAAYAALGIEVLPPCTLAEAYMRLWAVDGSV